MNFESISCAWRANDGETEKDKIDQNYVIKSQFFLCVPTMVPVHVHVVSM